MVVFGDKPILIVTNFPHCLLNKACHALVTLSHRYHMLHLFPPIWSVRSPLPGRQPLLWMLATRRLLCYLYPVTEHVPYTY